MGGGILTYLVFSPLIGAFFVLLQSEERSIWNSAFIFSLLPLALSLYLFRAFDPSQAGYQFVEQYHVDSAIRNFLSPRHGRHQPDAGRADDDPDFALAAVFRRRRYRPSPARVLLLHARARDRSARHAARGRPVHVLRVLGADAVPDVFPDRHLGTRPADLRRGQVRALYDDRLLPDAGRDHLPGDDLSLAQRRPHLRPADAVQHADDRDRGALDVRRVRARIRDQSPDVAGAHLAARRAHQRAHRRLGYPRGRDAEDGDLRLSAFRDPAVPGGRDRSDAAVHGARGDRNHLRRAGRDGAARSEKADRVLVGQPPGIRGARNLRLQSRKVSTVRSTRCSIMGFRPARCSCWSA